MDKQGHDSPGQMWLGLGTWAAGMGVWVWGSDGGIFRASGRNPPGWTDEPPDGSLSSTVALWAASPGAQGLCLLLQDWLGKSHQLHLTLFNPMDCSPLGSSVHEILQARILEWVAMLSSRGSFPPRDQTHCLLCLPH